MRPCRHPNDALPAPGAPYEPGSCRVCWLYANDASYRAHFDGVPAQNSEPAPAVGPCRHFVDAPLKRAGCGSCQAKWVYSCEVYGSCSPRGWHAGVRRCEGCPHYADRGSQQPEPAPRRVALVAECSPAEALALSAVLACLHRAHPGAFVTAVEGSVEDLFLHHPDVVAAEDTIEGRPAEWERVVLASHAGGPTARPARGVRFYCDVLAHELGVPVPALTERPLVRLSPDERARRPEVHEAAGGSPPYILIETSDWGEDSRRVLDPLRNRFLLVQVGDDSDTPPLPGVLDMRGRPGLRRLAMMVFHAAGGVGRSGRLRDLCAAFEKPFACLDDSAGPTDRLAADLLSAS